MMMYGCLIVPSSPPAFTSSPDIQNKPHSPPLFSYRHVPLSTFRRSFIHPVHTKGHPPYYPPRDQPGERTKTSLSHISSSCLRPHTTPRSKPRSHIYIRVLIPTSPCKHLVPQTLPAVVDFHHTTHTEDVTSRLYNPIRSIKGNIGNLRRRPSLHHHLRHYSKRTRRCRVAR
jgi:hypothetical protein